MIDLKQMDCHFERMSAYEVLQHLVQIGGIDAVLQSLGQIIEEQYIQKAIYIADGGVIVSQDGTEYAIQKPKVVR